jgi:hypothetical protein
VTSFTMVAELRRRRARRATAVTTARHAITTTGQNVAWSNQIRRWAFATRVVACRSRARLSMAAFHHASVLSVQTLLRERPDRTQAAPSRKHNELG